MAEALHGESSMGSHDISVVICTYNRCNDLRLPLTRCLPNVTRRREVIVVDNNSTDATAAVVDARRAASRICVRIRTWPGDCQAHATRAYRREVPIIAFTDDDIVVADSWVRSVYRAFLQYPNADCVGGPVLPRWPPSGRPTWFPVRQRLAGAAGQRRTAGFCAPAEMPPCLIGANFAFRKSAFAKSSGLFDPAYTPRTASSASTLEGGRSWRIRSRRLYVDIPAERLTKELLGWYGRTGRFHSHAAARSPRRRRADGAAPACGFMLA